MKKGKLTLLGMFVTLVVVIVLIIINTSIKGEIFEVRSYASPEIQMENENKHKELEEFSTFLFQEGGFFEQVSKKIKEKGYEFQMLIAFYSVDDIQVKYVLENKDATESKQEEIKSIFFDSVERNKLNSNSFNLKVGDSDDGPDW